MSLKTKESILKQISHIGIIRGVAMVFGALAQIYTARMLGPEKLGISTLALTIATPLVILAGSINDTMLIREYKRNEDREGLLETTYSYRTLICLGSILLLPVLFFIPQEYRLALSMVPFLTMFQSNTGMWVLQSEEKISKQYIATGIASILGACLTFLIINKQSNAGCDSVITSISTAVGFYLSWLWANGKLPKIKFHREKLIFLMKGSSILFLTSLISYCYNRLEQPLIAIYGGMEEIGLYRSALQIPNALFPFLNLFPLMLYPKLIDAFHKSKNDLWVLQKKIFGKIFIPVAVLSIATIVILPKIYPLIFGKAYQSAGLTCSLLIVSRMIVILNGIFCWGLWAEKKDKTMLGLMGITAIISILSNICLIPKFGGTGAASVNLISEVLVLTMGFAISYKNRKTSL
jgi:O-antigen/teichoic acid export membrane protein